MRFISIPHLTGIFYPQIIKSFPWAKGKLFFTFDDGPDAEVTPWVLDTLKQYNAKATFFCLGENVETNIDLYKRIIAEGHITGNHGFSHLNGFKTKTDLYIENIEKAEKLISSNLVRPPYGKLRPNQYNILKEKYKIVLWDIMAYDFDQSLTGKQCAELVIKNAKDGSIIVFHDTQKAKKNMLVALSILLKYYSSIGFEFDNIKI
jgi:peptidoglycan/xylan/chitin deacetylase (PgdA/CDA1 family)